MVCHVVDQDVEEYRAASPPSLCSVLCQEAGTSDLSVLLYVVGISIIDVYYRFETGSLFLAYQLTRLTRKRMELCGERETADTALT